MCAYGRFYHFIRPASAQRCETNYGFSIAARRWTFKPGKWAKGRDGCEDAMLHIVLLAFRQRPLVVF